MAENKKNKKFPWRTEEDNEKNKRFWKEVALRWTMWAVIDVVVTLLLMAVFPNVVVDTFIIATIIGCIVLCWCIEWAFFFLKIRKFRSWRWAMSIAGSISGGFILALIFVLTGVIQ